MNSAKKSMTAAIQALAQHREAQLESHPSPEELADYQDGLLAEQRRRELQNHLAVCRECMAVFAELASLSDLDDEPFPIQNQDPRRGFDSVPDQNQRPRSFRPYFLAAAFAAIAFASLAGNLVFYFIGQTRALPQTEVAVLDLLPIDEIAERGGDEEHSTAMSGPEGSLIIFLTLSDFEPQHKVRAHLLRDNPERSVLWRSNAIGIPRSGLIPIQIPGAFLDSDHYRIHLMKDDADGQNLLAEYKFEITKNKKPTRR